MGRRLLFDNDGHSFVLDLGCYRDIQSAIRDLVQDCPPNVTTYMHCPGAGKFLYPTKVADRTPANLQGAWTALVRSHQPAMEKLHAAFGDGIDPMGMFVRGLRESGKEAFFSFRMNDVHDPDHSDGWNIPTFRKEHPEMIVDVEATRATSGDHRADWMNYCLDYTRPEVRQYKLSIIRELVEMYEIDGFHLDWMRFPRHLSGTPDEVWGKRDIITGFTEEVRDVVKSQNSGIELSARVPASVEGCRYLGFDLAEWGRRGLVDFIIASNFLAPDYYMPIQELRTELGDPSIPIYASFEVSSGTQLHNPESLRAMCLSLYSCGADAISLFNFPCWNFYFVVQPYDMLAGLESPEYCAQKPLLFTVPHAYSRHEHFDLPSQVPATVGVGDVLGLTLYLPAEALPFDRALVLVQSGGDIDLTVNGQPTYELPGYARRAELFPVHTTDWVGKLNPFAEFRPKRDETRVFRAEPTSLLAGSNSLVVTNAAGGELEIKRVHLGLW